MLEPLEIMGLMKDMRELIRLLFGGRHAKTGYFAGADFPHTVANVIDKETGKSILPPYIIKKVGGVPIGFIGVVTTETTKFVLPDGIKGLEFTDEVTAINAAAKNLKAEGVKAIVVLAHNSVSTKKMVPIHLGMSPSLPKR